MRNILIADAGSTKVDWALLSGEGEVASSFGTEGVNALLSTSEELGKVFAECRENVGESVRVDEVAYYGAGCATPEICGKLSSVIKETWPGASTVNVSSDLLGAARSLFGKGRGIACILGTGSNSCLYDNGEIRDQIPSLGYVLGDEGSGAALGKRLLRDAFKKQLPENILDKFMARYGLGLPDILEKVYRKSSPNRFLASLTPFLQENLWNPYIYSLVLEELTGFVKHNIAMYPGAHSMEIGFTGSIAFHFEKLLREAACSLGYRVAKVSASPMEGLIDYHKNEQ